MKPLTDLQRANILKYAMPDRATFEYTATSVVDDYGIPQNTIAYRHYLNSTDIPCRLDLQRAVYNDKLKDMAVTVNPYVLEVPHDFVFDESDIVTIKGEKFKIRREFALQAWAVTQELLLIGVTYD